MLTAAATALQACLLVTLIGTFALLATGPVPLLTIGAIGGASFCGAFVAALDRK